MKKIKEIGDNLESQFNELRNKMNEQKKYFTKDIENMKQPRISDAEKLNKWDKKSFKSTGRSAFQVKEKMNEL